MSGPTSVMLPKEVLEGIYAGAKHFFPRESFLLLRGKKRKNIIHITDLLMAPLSVHGYASASFPSYMLPMDFSIVGTVHSHPSGNISPSDVDLNHFFGRILMIVGPPFEGKECVAVYDSNGDRMPIEITEP